LPEKGEGHNNCICAKHQRIFLEQSDSRA
jgi:hypothetical protein